MKVLLLNPPSEKGLIRTGRWVRYTRGNQSWYPTLLSYCCALLERENHDCKLIDASVENLTYNETEMLIDSFHPDWVVYYWSYDTAKDDLWFADILAQTYNVVLVGPWSYCMPDALSQAPRVRAMTYGEFEHTVVELIKNIYVHQVQGLIWRNHLNGELIRTPPRPLCSSEELDRIPFVTKVYKRHLNVKNYRQTSLRYPFVDTYTTRGCPHNCTYCVFPRALQGGPSYRSRSIKDVLDELWWINDELPEVKQIFFQDDTLPEKHATELSQAILDESLKICWGGYTRAELSYETLKLMKDSGCRTLHVGYEIPIQQHLDTIQKNTKVERMAQFAADILKLKMWTSATFMIFPWETPEEIKTTIDWCKAIEPKRMNFIQAQAYPNTPYTDTIKSMGKQHKLMTYEEMEKWERYGFKKFYFRRQFLWEVLKSPREWKNVLKDAKGLINFLYSTYRVQRYMRGHGVRFLGRKK